MSNGGSYDPHAIEADIYKFWEQGGYFHAEPDPNRKPYVIDIPLPNVTGSLHLGHALNNTIQDILIRYKRMCGYNAMWMPGTDHAGIATQAVVEKRLKEEENLTRHEIGRDGLVERIWAWKEKYGGEILQQLRRMGCSCDWERTRFTLDEVCAKAVYEVFFRWFKDGLIYRGLRLVNWDAALQTAVADDEIIHETVQGHLWHYRYPILREGEAPAEPGSAGASPSPAARAAIERATHEDAKPGQDYLVIATTRPETMLGDTAVAVHPDDERYKHLVGRNCLLPLANRPIPIIADDVLVDPQFGTGCVKVTPGHDPNDYEFGQRHEAEIAQVVGQAMINILTIDGRINENGGKYKGMTIEESRGRVVEDLEALGLMEKVEPYQHEVGHSDRSKTPIEPMLSEQWFMRMGELADMTMDAVRDGRVKFFPERYAKTYLDWLGEKRDWCISRQLWWGHRIPIWSFPTVESLRGVFRNPDQSAAQRLEEFEASGRVARRTGYEPWGQERLPAKIDRVRYRFRDGRILDSVTTNTQWCPTPDAMEEFDRFAESIGMQQDPDVLDTWFSSALWPFSTLGWPDNYGRHKGTEARRHEGEGEAPAEPSAAEPLPKGSAGASPSLSDLEYFYPTSTLVTARGIITLWVARMVMTSLYFNKCVPFDHVHIHPIIQDGQGRTMSKSLGNGVDPLDIIELFGTDAMRFALAQMATETQDVRMPVKPVKLPDGRTVNSSEKFELGRNFCNKLWQAATGFVLPNLERQGGTAVSAVSSAPGPLKPDELAIEDHWILSRLAGCIEEVDRRFERYQINELANALYSFFWSDFCDWYIELVKPRLYGSQGQDARAAQSAAVGRQVLAWVLDQTLRLLHPIAPFITEALWKRLNDAAPQRGIFTICSVGPPSPTSTGPPSPTSTGPPSPTSTGPPSPTRTGPPSPTGQAHRHAGTQARSEDGLTISSALITASWPDATAWSRERDVERDMQTLQDVIRSLRDIRAHVNHIRAAGKQSSVRKLPQAVIRADAQTAQQLRQRLAVIQRLGQCEALQIGPDVTKPPESASKVIPCGTGFQPVNVEVYVPLTGLADLEVERRRLSKERDELAGHLKRLEAKLANENFVSKAPAAVVERERARRAELKERLAAIEQNLAEVGG
jgi:valyl-tRNA synthetase